MLVRTKVMSQPNAWWSVAGRSTEIILRLGGFLASWSADQVMGRNNNPLSVAKRASQLRYAFACFQKGERCLQVCEISITWMTCVWHSLEHLSPFIDRIDAVGRVRYIPANNLWIS